MIEQALMGYGLYETMQTLTSSNAIPTSVQ